MSGFDTDWLLLFGAWLVAAVATAGSLFFSEVMALPPCSLCWYQRVFMFPLALVLLVAVLGVDRHVGRYALPLTALGWAVAGYHVLLTWGIVPETLVPCGQGVSCADQPVVVFGFVSIPLMSWVAFTLIGSLLAALSLRARP